MSRSRGRPGPPPRWGGLSTKSVRWPHPHGKVYEHRASELGMSISEYVARVMAQVHGLEFPGEPERDDQQELPLGA